jgi:hypothetical protein
MRSKRQILYNLQINELVVSFFVYTYKSVLFLISNFCLVMNVIFFILVDFPLSKFYFSDVLKHSVSIIF